MSVSVQLEPEDIEVLLQTYLGKYAAAVAVTRDLEGKIHRLQALVPKTHIQASHPTISDATAETHPGVQRVTTTTPGGRVPRGKTKELVEDFLKGKNGTGATIPEIALATGTKYPTVRRIVTELRVLRKVHEGKMLDGTGALPFTAYRQRYRRRYGRRTLSEQICRMETNQQGRG